MKDDNKRTKKKKNDYQDDDDNEDKKRRLLLHLKKQDQRARKKIKFDPKATESVIARENHLSAGKKKRVGDLTKEINQRKEKLSKEERERIEIHLNGPNATEGKERLNVLAKDDNLNLQNKPNSSTELEINKKWESDKLNPYQRRSLWKRQSRSNRKLKHTLERHEYKRWNAASMAADAQYILQGTSDNNNNQQQTSTTTTTTDNNSRTGPGFVQPENEMEKTIQLTQLQLKRKYLPEQTAAHIYDLNLPHYGPYGMKYDRSGRFGLLYGHGGHVALMDCQQRALSTEFFLNQNGNRQHVRDACFLHNSSLFAVAQSHQVYIYDDKGAEIHRLNQHTEPQRLDYLPHHWLLVSVGSGRAGILRYQDVTTGEAVATHHTQLGHCKVMRQNPSNAVVHCGHLNGTVTLWSPANPKYLAKIHCHKGSAISSLVVDRTGNIMVTAGTDRKIRVWDLRRTFREMHYYELPYTSHIPATMDISQRGVLGIGHGSSMATFLRPEALQTYMRRDFCYMKHTVSLPPSSAGVSRQQFAGIETLRFRPFEDVCGLGHGGGVSSIVIPGSGEYHLDSQEYHTNPYQERRQQREAEVRSLLDKLRPDMIALDPDVVGTIEASHDHLRAEREADLEGEQDEKEQPQKREKNKKRGRSKIQTKLRRKSQREIQDNTAKFRQALEKDEDNAGERNAGTETKEKVATATTTTTTNAAKDRAPAALKRFF